MQGNMLLVWTRKDLGVLFHDLVLLGQEINHVWTITCVGSSRCQAGPRRSAWDGAECAARFKRRGIRIVAGQRPNDRPDVLWGTFEKRVGPFLSTPLCDEIPSWL